MENTAVGLCHMEFPAQWFPAGNFNGIHIKIFPAVKHNYHGFGRNLSPFGKHKAVIAGDIVAAGDAPENLDIRVYILHAVAKPGGRALRDGKNISMALTQGFFFVSSTICPVILSTLSLERSYWYI